MREQFTGFYPTPPPWFGASVDWDVIDHDPSQLGKQMSEATFSRKERDFELRLARDGEVLLRDVNLEQTAAEHKEQTKMPIALLTRKVCGKAVAYLG